MRLHDTMTMDAEPTYTTDGYMTASAKVAREGIQMYTGAEMGKPEMAKVRVLRPQDEVFSDETMHSFAHRPMTNDHPSEPVTSANWKDNAIGYTGDEVARDGDSIRVPLVMMDGAAIQQFADGKRELSMGYDAEIDWTPGTTDDGQAYDAIQRNIRNNHVALVQNGRAGNARIGDTGGQSTAGKHQGGQKMAELRKLTVDGLTVETTDQGAEAIEKLQQHIADAEQTHKEAIDAKDAELANRDATIDDLKGKVLDESQMDQAVKARADLIGKARAVADVDYSGKSESDIKRTAVATVLGDEAIKDKADAYVDARFDVLHGEAGKPATTATTQSTQDAQAAYESRIYGEA